MVERVKLRNRAAEGGNYFSKPNDVRRFIPSGCRVLDRALGGGWAEGRVSNIVGDKSTGKTLLCIEASANFVMKYPKAKIRYREAESAFDEGYAGALGMPLSNVDFGDPMETVEEFYKDVRAIVTKAKGPELVILDSLDALSDKAELERDMEEGSYGAEKAKKMSQFFRRLVRELEEKQITLMIVSQIRDKMNARFGRKVTRTGGRALDFYASQVLFLAHIGTVSRTVHGQNRVVAIKVKGKLDKNKIGPAFREADFKIRFGYGIDDAEACIQFLKGTGGLKALNIRDDKKFMEELAAMDAANFGFAMRGIHKEVDKQWYAIEQSLLPTRQKYGALNAQA